MDQDCTVLVIDDDEGSRAALCEFLAAAGYRVRTALGGGEGLSALATSPPDAVLLDLVMPAPDGFEVLRQVRARDARLPIVVLSALSDAEDVVRAMKLGATDYLPKPFDVSELDLVLRRALDAPGRRPPDVAPRVEAAPGPADVEITPTLSAAMERVWTLVKRIADTDVPVLLVGESGVGKDVVARRIHATSHRAGRAFVKINCAALPGELLESELFGHEKGAFTGAHAEKPGKFELANHGTIFLDEIGEMGLDMQVKLLRVLQNREFRRIGGSHTLKVDVRVIAATNRELKAEVERKRFRPDLFYRLNVISLEIPPLRERLEEVPELIASFCERLEREKGIQQKTFSADAVVRMQKCRWPGNVRELENAVERLVLLAPGPSVTPADVEEHLADTTPIESPFTPTLTLDEVKRIHIAAALKQNGGNKMRTARLLGINVKTLYNLIKSLSIPLE